MLKKLFVLLVILSIAAPCFAQIVDTAWVRRYNSPANSSDQAYAIAVDGSGNVCVTGYSYDPWSWTEEDYTTIKYHPNGDTAWIRGYSGPGDSTDIARAIAVDDSGYVYVTGESVFESWYSYADYATIKYYPDGDTAWVRRYNGPGDYDDVARAIAVNGSGNVYVTGRSVGSGTDDDYATIKYEPNGDTAWVRRYNGPGNGWDYAYAIAVDASGNVYVTGVSVGSEPGSDYATIKYYPSGDTAWVRRYDGPGDNEDLAIAIAVDDLGNIYVTGRSYDSVTVYDYATVKYEPNGDTAWVRRYNGPENSYDEASAITVDGSGNVYVTGYSTGSGTSTDYATIKYYPNGDTAWVRKYNGPGNDVDVAYSIAVDDSGNVYVTGRSEGSGTSRDYATIKYSASGDELWVKRYNGPGNYRDEARAIAVDDSGNVHVVGYSYGAGTDYDYATIKYSQRFPPTADFVGSPVIGEKNLQVSFTDLSEGEVDSWYWSFGDGYFSLAQNPTHTYTAAGSYDVKLIATNQDGSDTLIKEDYIQVLAKPLADFTADPTVGSPPLGVQFTDNTIGDITDWLWDFGDDSISTLQNPYHEYTSFGIYDVTLIATSANGSDTLTKEDFIFAYPAFSGDSVKVLSVTAFPNQEDVVVPIIQSNDYDSLARIKVPLLYNDTSSVRVGVDSVSFAGSRAAHFEQKVVEIDEENAAILIYLTTDQSPYLEIGEGLLAKIYLKVKDGVPPTGIVFQDNAWDTVLFVNWDYYSPMEAGFSPGTLFVEKAESVPPATPQDLAASALESGISLTWTPVEEPDLRLYAIYRNTSVFTPGSLDDTLATSLEPFYLDSDVSWGETYFFRVSALDSSWNESEYSDTASATFGDSDPPVITLGPTVIAVTDSTGTIYWETDEKADGYGEIYIDTNWVTADSHLTFLLEHTATVTWLEPSTSYEFRVHSTDSLDNGPTYSGTKSFTTASAPDVTPPQIIFGPAVVFKTHNSATIQWTTDEIAFSKVYFGREPSVYSDSALGPGFVTSHSITLDYLYSETQYFYLVSSEDPSGNGPMLSGNFYAAGDWSGSIFSADLDGDSDLDLAVGNNTDKVSILKNNGDGSFQSAVSYGVGEYPTSVFCADLDGDEDVDLAVSIHDSDSICILENNGNGTFQSAVNYGAGHVPTSVFCADLDGDTDLDLAVANEYSNDVSVLKNNGDGTFQSAVSYGAGNGPASLFCADLDGDTDLDLAVANINSDSISILENNGNGTFQSAVNYGAGDAPISVFCADLDGDEDVDLAVTNLLSYEVSIFKNNGNGTFQTKVDYGTGTWPEALFCADLDGDEDTDLAIAGGCHVSILKNNGDGTFQTNVQYVGGSGLTSVFCADLDWDTDLDLALANFNTNSVCILLNNGDGTFPEPPSFTTEAAPDEIPPAIVEGPIHSGITHNKAVISWLTDEISTSIVQYGPSQLYGSEKIKSDFVQSHQIALTNLQDSALYHYRVGSVDPASNGPTWSSDFWFWTQSTPDTTSPIILTCAYASWVNDTEAQIEWTTDEISDSWVYYGLEGSYDNAAGSPTHLTEHTVVLTNLIPDTTYNYYVSSTDPSGNTVESEHTGGGLHPLDAGDDQFTTKASPDVSPPVIISGPFVSYKSHNQAIVKWVTDETGNSIAEYGETQGYGRVVTYPKATTNHTAFLSNLLPNTTYHFRVGSVDIANNGPTYSSDVTFTTVADVVDINPPVITVGPHVPYLDSSRAVITWTTDEPANSYMGYELIGGLAERVVGESYNNFEHMMNLTLASSYNVRVFSTDAHGNGPTYSDYFVVTAPTSPDVQAPIVTDGPEVVYVSETSAKIRWETDELSSSFIEYGLTEEYTDIEGNPDNNSLHLVTLTNLVPSTTYHYRVKSADLFGNIYLGPDSILFTQANSDTTAPLAPTGISSSYGNQLAKLSWNENLEGDLSGYNLYRGTTTSILSLVASNLTDTSYQDQGLTNETTYYYQLTSRDQSGNESPASEMVCARPLSYLLGDFNGDGAIGVLPDVVDIVAMVNYVFKSGEGYEPLEAANVNCDADINVVDIVYLVNYVFKMGEEPCNCIIPEQPLARYENRAKAFVGLCFPEEERTGEIEVLLEAEIEEEVAGIELDLNFDPSQLEVKEISTTSRTEGLGLFHNVKLGKVKIGIVDIYGTHTVIPGEGSILKLKFQMKGKRTEISSVHIENAILVSTLAQELDVQIRPNKLIRSIPQIFSLSQNYPNPFNARTVIKYSLPQDSKVEITIYNILGRKVNTLVNEHQQAGYKTVIWDGTNQKNTTVASGVYFYKIKAGDFTSSKKMLLLK